MSGAVALSHRKERRTHVGVTLKTVGEIPAWFHAQDKRVSGIAIKERSTIGIVQCDIWRYYTTYNRAGVAVVSSSRIEYQLQQDSMLELVVPERSMMMINQADGSFYVNGVECRCPFLGTMHLVQLCYRATSSSVRVYHFK